MESLINFIRYYTVYRWMSQFLHKKGSILDFGCGKGEFVSYLRKRGQEAYGVDPEIKPMSFLFASLACLEENIHKPFEAIILNFSLEHFDNPLSTLKKLCTLLTPDGLFFIRVPNSTNTFKNKLLYSFQLKILSHRSFFTPKSIAELLNNSGFRVLKIDTHFCTTSALTIPCSIFPQLDPMNWLYKTKVSTRLQKGLILSVLCLLFSPYVLLESQIGQGPIIYAVAQRNL